MKRTESDTQLDFQFPPKKKLRKGTHSCLECRRRKVKCIFREDRSDVCTECLNRGLSCVDQGSGDFDSHVQHSVETLSKGLKDWTHQLESLVNQLLTRFPQSPAQSVQSSQPNYCSDVLRCLEQKGGNPIEEAIPNADEKAPALSLFDNAVFSRKHTPAQASQWQIDNGKSIVLELLAVLPVFQQLETIIDEVSGWRILWRFQCRPPEEWTREHVRDVLQKSLGSGDPAEIGKSILCLAMVIGYLPHSFDLRTVNLSGTQLQVMEIFVGVVNRLVTSNDEIAATWRGVECLALEAKYNIQLGRPRRAWLLVRRAISFAHLLGFPRLPYSKLEDRDQEWKIKVRLWMHLFMGDRTLSLLLGLPHCIPEQICKLFVSNQSGDCDCSAGEVYMLRLSFIIGKIVDRNQDPTLMTYANTLQIDQELEELAQAHPLHELQDSKQARPADDPENVYLDMALFMHHHARSMLHMPFMLKTFFGKRYSYSHSAALDSARQMIRYFECGRNPDFGHPFMDRLMDFHVFTAALMLLLNLIASPLQVRSSVEEQTQNGHDIVLVGQTIDLLKQSSLGPGGEVSSQCALALQTLTRARNPDNSYGRNGEMYQVVIPYFGKITIGPGKHLYENGGKSRSDGADPPVPVQYTESDFSQSRPPIYQPTTNFNSGHPMPEYLPSQGQSLGGGSDGRYISVEYFTSLGSGMPQQNSNLASDSSASGFLTANYGGIPDLDQDWNLGDLTTWQ